VPRSPLGYIGRALIIAGAVLIPVALFLTFVHFQQFHASGWKAYASTDVVLTVIASVSVVLVILSFLHKLWGIDYEEWLGARDAWQLATLGGAQAAGDAAGLGVIEPGRRADLVLLDLESRVFTPLNDPLHQLAFGSTTLAVDSVLVGGEWSVREGSTTRID
jgi:cytosine/adenosine deaminase-related metal-dependent hydrolase